MLWVIWTSGCYAFVFQQPIGIGPETRLARGPDFSSALQKGPLRTRLRSTVLRKNKNIAVEGGTVSHYYILVIRKFKVLINNDFLKHKQANINVKSRRFSIIMTPFFVIMLICRDY